MSGRDPSLRPYRFAAWALYIGIILVMVSLTVVSVARTLRGTVHPRPSEGPLPTRAALRVCFSDLEILYQDQNRHAWVLAADLDGKDPLAAWSSWSHRWESKLDDLSERCRLDSLADGEEGVTQRAELAEARDAVLLLHRSYNGFVNRFADQYRDLVRSTADALARARQGVNGPQ
jgi:hypothetical protein